MINDTLVRISDNLNTMTEMLTAEISSYASGADRVSNEIEVAGEIIKLIDTIQTAHNQVEAILNEHEITQRSEIPIKTMKVPNKVDPTQNIMDKQYSLMWDLKNIYKFPLDAYGFNVFSRISKLVFYRDFETSFIRVNQKFKPFLVNLSSLMLAYKFKGRVIKHRNNVCVQLKVPAVIIEVERQVKVNRNLHYDEWQNEVYFFITQYRSLNSLPYNIPEGIIWTKNLGRKSK